MSQKSSRSADEESDDQGDRSADARRDNARIAADPAALGHEDLISRPNNRIGESCVERDVGLDLLTIAQDADLVLITE